MILADNGESSLESSKSKGLLFCTGVQQSPTAKSIIEDTNLSTNKSLIWHILRKGVGD